MAKFPFYTPIMFMVYMSIYFTICTNPQDSRNDGLDLDTGRGKEVYRWYTYSLLHLNAMHIGVNMFCLLIYCGLVEWDHGTWRTFAIHTCSILGGAFAAGWEARILKERLYVIGVSGGNYGMLSSQIGNLVLNWPELTLMRRIFYPLLLCSCVISDVVVNIVLYNDQISYSAHVGGFVFGVFAGMTLMKNIRKLAWERRMQYVMASVFFVITLVGSINLGLSPQ